LTSTPFKAAGEGSIRNAFCFWLQYQYMADQTLLAELSKARYRICRSGQALLRFIYLLLI
jgi:hypothetical protein